MLSLTHNKDTRRTTLTPNVDAILKRSHNELIVIRLVDGDNELFQLSGDQSLLVVLKPKPYRELSLLVADGDDHGILIDEADYDSETRTYRKVVDLYTVPVNTLLNIDGDSSNDIASAPCVAEVSFSLEAGDDWEPGTTLDFTLENAIMSDEDSTPASVADPDADWVAHGHAQTLTAPQKTQAQANINAADATATSSELAAKAPIASPTFSGTPAAPTASPGTNTTQIATTAFVLANAGSIPAGIVSPYAGTTEPSGWLFCYGQSLLRTDYSALFTAIGTTYGAVDGTHFSLPDLRGRVVAGQDDMGGTSANRLTNLSGFDGDVLGNTGGAETHTLSAGELAAHSHDVNSVTVPIYAGGISSTPGTNSAQGVDEASTNQMNVVGSTGNGGSNQPHNNVQPTLILNYIIKT